MASELDFAPDLNSIRERVAALSYFTDVRTLQEAALDLEEMNGIPPLAYVSTASETAEPNKLIGSISQRVSTRISVLFCVPAERADDKTRDELEEARKAVIRILLGWTPLRAEKPFEFDRFLLRASRDGLLWGEVLMLTTYRLTLA
jgi:hypothetical protein